jgi:hypothetical protein
MGNVAPQSKRRRGQNHYPWWPWLAMQAWYMCSLPPVSATGNDLTDRFPLIVEAMARLSLHGCRCPSTLCARPSSNDLEP